MSAILTFQNALFQVHLAGRDWPFLAVALVSSDSAVNACEQRARELSAHYGQARTWAATSPGQASSPPVEVWTMARPEREVFFQVSAGLFEHRDYEKLATMAWEGLGLKAHPGHYATDPGTPCEPYDTHIEPAMRWTEWVFRTLHRARQLQACTLADGSILSWYPGRACQASLKALELLPEETRKTSPEGCTHSSDFRSVCWFGAAYVFTPGQAAVVKVLWEQWERGTPDIGEAAILEEAEVQSRRLMDLFRQRVNGKLVPHPAWGAMIQMGATKGTFRLALPENIF
jgi:hypothetical protein